MTTLPVRQLHHHLKDRTPLGFGVSGPIATRLFSSHETDRLIGAARDQGISIFDTAPSYGAGLGERRLGRAIGNDPAAFVMTKAGLTAKGWFDRASDFAPGSIVQSVENSLRRLQRDRIDLLWLHGPGREQINEPLTETLTELIRSGKIAAVGIASRNLPASAIAGTGPFSAIMAPVSQVTSRPAPHSGNPVVFGIECLQSVPSDNGLPRHRSHLWRSARALVRNQDPIRGTSSVDAAFAFAFETAQCDVVITTTTKSSRIQQNRIICEDIADRSRKPQNHILVRPGQAQSAPPATLFQL